MKYFLYFFNVVSFVNLLIS